MRAEDWPLLDLLQEADARIVPGVLGNDRRAFITGAVVDDEDLIGRHGLSQHTSQGFADEAGTIVQGDDRGDAQSVRCRHEKLPKKSNYHPVINVSSKELLGRAQIQCPRAAGTDMSA